MTELLPLWQRAVTGELCWLDREGRPSAMAVTPLVEAGSPCVALPYAHADTVASLREASTALFAVTDSRSLRAGQPGMAATGSVHVTDDPDGERFVADLLPQELRKYPPSRVLADSPLLRRENWWWLPRILIRLDAVTMHRELPARTNPAREALLVRDALGLAVDVVEVPDGTGERAVLREPRGAALRGDGAPAFVLGYDYTIPDLERWESWSLEGTLLGDELAVTARTGDPGAELPPLRLMERIRRQRTLTRACREGLRAR